MNIYAPVIVFTYNRLDHTKKTLSALNNAVLAEKTDLFIFCDNYKNEQARDSVIKVREYVDVFTQSACFKTVVVEKAEHNKGLANSIIEGASRIIDKYGKAIIVEDDLEVSTNFLVYMNGALDYYQNKQNVWAISGYSFPMKALENYNHDVYYSGRGCSWGWATWKDRWDTVDWNVSDYSKFKHNWLKRYKFGKWGCDLPLMLDRQVILNINSWAIRWCYQAFKENKYTVYPKVSLLKNLGTDGSGTHSSVALTKFNTTVNNLENYSFQFEELEINKKIQKEFAQKYSRGWIIDIKSEIKGLFLRFNIQL